LQAVVLRLQAVFLPLPCRHLVKKASIDKTLGVIFASFITFLVASGYGAPIDGHGADSDDASEDGGSGGPCTGCRSGSRLVRAHLVPADQAYTAVADSSYAVVSDLAIKIATVASLARDLHHPQP